MLQVETLRLCPGTVSQSVTGRAGFTIQMLQIETIESRDSKTTTKTPVPIVVAELATTFPQIKPAKINLSLIGRF